MILKFVRLLNRILLPFNIKLSRVNSNTYPVDATKRDIEIIDYILSKENFKKRLAMATVDKLMAVIQSTKYIVKNNIKGDFVECGVWRGGCSLAIAMVLKDLKEKRKIFLFDTFEGMTKPGEEDIGYNGFNALRKFFKSQRVNYNKWCYASLDDVKSQFKKLNLEDYATFIKGDVIKTLKEEINLPKNIALLRLDTDWYESTKIEMQTLYPRVVKDGVLLIDDYADWQGCKKAVDEYFIENNLIYHSMLWGNQATGKGLVKR